MYYQADSWTTARRVVAKVEHHVSELFPRVGFIVTNLLLPNRAVLRFYNKRGTAAQWIKEGRESGDPDVCHVGHRPRANARAVGVRVEPPIDRLSSRRLRVRAKHQSRESGDVGHSTNGREDLAPGVPEVVGRAAMPDELRNS